MIEQGSQEWLAQRLGKLTASKMADVLAKTKSGPAASRQNYLAQLVCERLTGKAAEAWASDAMKRGTELEPAARAAYEAHSGELVLPAEFVTHPDNELIGASPDGLIGDDGLLEIKCLNAANHIEVLKYGMPTKYKAQVQTQLWVTGRAWCDFCAYHPDFPEKLQLKVTRVAADLEYHKTLRIESVAFLAEVEIYVAELSSENVPNMQQAPITDAVLQNDSKE